MLWSLGPMGLPWLPTYRQLKWPIALTECAIDRGEHAWCKALGTTVWESIPIVALWPWFLREPCDTQKVADGEVAMNCPTAHASQDNSHWWITEDAGYHWIEERTRLQKWRPNVRRHGKAGHYIFKTASMKQRLWAANRTIFAGERTVTLLNDSDERILFSLSPIPFIDHSHLSLT